MTPYSTTDLGEVSLALRANAYRLADQLES